SSDGWNICEHVMVSQPFTNPHRSPLANHRRLLARTVPPFPVRYADHIDGDGISLFKRVCELDLEGVVAKLKYAPYVSDRKSSTWVKILNRSYSQKQGREEQFERERSREPVPGWHSCVIACSELPKGTSDSIFPER